MSRVDELAQTVRWNWDGPLHESAVDALVELERLAGEADEAQQGLGYALACMAEWQERAKFCPACGHAWSRHDPADGMCDSHADEEDVLGPCRCGRDIAFTTAANARLSRATLEAAE